MAVSEFWGDGVLFLCLLDMQAQNKLNKSQGDINQAVFKRLGLLEARVKELEAVLCKVGLM